MPTFDKDNALEMLDLAAEITERGMRLAQYAQDDPISALVVARELRKELLRAAQKRQTNHSGEAFLHALIGILYCGAVEELLLSYQESEELAEPLPH